MCALVSQVILEQGANRVGFVKEVYIEIKRANVQALIKQQKKTQTNCMIKIQKYLLLKENCRFCSRPKKTTKEFAPCKFQGLLILIDLNSSAIVFQPFVILSARTEEFVYLLSSVSVLQEPVGNIVRNVSRSVQFLHS